MCVLLLESEEASKVTGGPHSHIIIMSVQLLQCLHACGVAHVGNCLLYRAVFGLVCEIWTQVHQPLPAVSLISEIVNV